MSVFGTWDHKLGPYGKQALEIEAMCRFSTKLRSGLFGNTTATRIIVRRRLVTKSSGSGFANSALALMVWSQGVIRIYDSGRLLLQGAVESL